jgi:hypothetical protein
MKGRGNMPLFFYLQNLEGKSATGHVFHSCSSAKFAQRADVARNFFIYLRISGKHYGNFKLTTQLE